MSSLRELASAYTSSTLEATPKQLELIRALKPDFVFDRPIMKSEVHKIIAEIKQGTKINEAQMIYILSNIELRDLEQILGRKQIVLPEITLFEYDNIKKVISGKIHVNSRNFPILIADGYEYGYQESKLFVDNKMFYLKFVYFMMIDLDFKLPLEEIASTAERLGLTVRVYTSFTGYHIFITSRPIIYNSGETSEISREFKGDIFYRLYSQKAGFKVRLNPKLGRSEGSISEYVATFGTEPEDPKLLSLLEVHDEYIAKFR